MSDDAKAGSVQIFGMVHSQNVLGPLMIATHYKLGELAFTNLFEDRTPEFKAMNPFNKCPVLKDGDFVIAESSACLRYLAMKYVPSLYPRATRKRAAASTGRSTRCTAKFTRR